MHVGDGELRRRSGILITVRADGRVVTTMPEIEPLPSPEVVTEMLEHMRVIQDAMFKAFMVPPPMPPRPEVRYVPQWTYTGPFGNALVVKPQYAMSVLSDVVV